MLVSLQFVLLLKGVCNNSPIDWIYYLTREAGEIFYEGYKNEQWKKVGGNWVTSNYLNDNNAFIEMNTADNSKQYPVGSFMGDIYDPNA